MEETPRIGVYVCYCGSNIAGTVDVEEVAKYAAGIPNVVVAKTYKYMCSDPGQELIKQDIKNLKLNRVVVASCSPLMHEGTFRRAVAEAGLNPYLYQMANIREQVSWVTKDREKATAKAKALVNAAVRRVALHEPLQRKEFPVNPNVLVVGGGIAGIEAALKCASAGKKVYLVEKEPTIGGHMAKFDKTFPTLDCAACILTPKMTDVGRHPNIEMMSWSEVEEVSGFVGNFKVKVKKKSRFVKDSCTGCADCLSVCPVDVPSEFEQGLAMRKAIYRPFPQAVPGIMIIDKKGVSPCRTSCPAGTFAHAYIQMARTGKYEKALEITRRTIPLPSACGRVCYHYCELDCARGELDEPIAINPIKRFVGDYGIKANLKPAPFKKQHDEKVAVIGGGPAGLACAHQLAMKGYETTIFESAPEAGGIMRWGIPNFRMPKDVLKKEIEYLQAEGINIKTGIKVNDAQSLLNDGYKAVLIATGTNENLKLKVEGEELKGIYPALDFLYQINSGKNPLVGDKVVVVGGGNTATDAARSALRLGAKEVTILFNRTEEDLSAHPELIADTKAEGIKFHYQAIPVQFKGAGKVAEIVCRKTELGNPDSTGRRRVTPIEGSEFTIPADTVIVALGDKSDLGELGKNIKTTPWGTYKVDSVTLETSVKGVFAAGDCVTSAASIVEAFYTGNEAAESIHRTLRGEDMKKDRQPVVKVGRPDFSKKYPKAPRQKNTTTPVAERVKNFAEVDLGLSEPQVIKEAERCLNCAVCCECYECATVCGDRKNIDYNMPDQTVELEVGAIIVATGFKLFDAAVMERYGYGKLPNVYNSLEFERLTNASGPTSGEVLLRNGKKPESVAILHCIGSRDKEYHAYCSRVCCMYALKFAHLVVEKVKGAKIYDFYIDMRAFGKGYEEFYNRLLEEGVEFVRGKVAEVTDFYEKPEEEGKLIVKAEDTLLGTLRRIPVDMVVLCNGLTPGPNANTLNRVFGISCSQEGFFLEKHPKLAPVSTANDGVYIAGTCQGPKDIPDTVAQGAAAACEAIALIDKGKVDIEPIYAVVNEDLCSGCRICNTICPYSAIEFDEVKKVSRVNEALCKGCGTCVATCPSSAITARHYTDEEIMTEIEGILVG